MTNALTGSALLDMIRKMESADRTTQCLTCGYVRENGKPAFTAFYEAILEARGVITAKVEKEEMLGEYPEQNEILTELLRIMMPTQLKRSLHSMERKNWRTSLMLTKAKCLAQSLQNS